MATKIWLGNDSGNEGDWSVAANFSPAGVPVNDDDVYLEDSSQSVIAGLDQSAVALASLNIAQSFTGLIGTATAYLQIGASAVNIGYHYGPGSAVGSGMLKIDLGATAATIIVFNSGIPSDATEAAIKLLCNNAATTLEVRKGKASIATGTGETSTLGTINTSYITSITSDAKVYIGSGVTLTTLTKKGGYCLLLCAATTVSNYDGDLLTEGSGAIATLNAKDGTVVSNSTGTITNCNISDKGTVDFTKSAQPRTVTNCKVDDEGAVKADPNVITFTNGILSNEPVTLRASAA